MAVQKVIRTHIISLEPKRLSIYAICYLNATSLAFCFAAMNADGVTP